MIPTNPIPEVPNYGSSAIYKDLPSPEQIRAGVIPLDSLPAAWWNALWACTNTAVNEARSAVGTLITEVCNAITGAGICINPSCVDQLYQAIETIRQRIGNAAVAGAVKSSPNCGEVSIDANGIMTANGVGNAALLNTSSKVIVNAINELKSTYDCCFTDLSSCIGSVDNSKAPTSHASANTTYGVGNADCYGHVKISDEYTCCVGAAADGIAASQLAVYCVYQAVQSAAGLGNTAGCALGTASAGTCNSAARSDHVHPLPSCVADKYGSSMIGIGYACAGLTCAQLANLAAFSTSYTSGCTVIKDVSKATVQCWLGLGGAAYCAAGCFRASTWTPSCVSYAGVLLYSFSNVQYAVQMTAAGSCICVSGYCLGVGTSSARPVRVAYADCASKDGSGCAFGTAARYPDGRYAFAANGNQNCVSYAGTATSATSATKLDYYKDMFMLCKSNSGTTCVYLVNRCAFPGVLTLSPSTTTCCGVTLNGSVGRYYSAKYCQCVCCNNCSPFCVCFGGFRVG